MLTEEEEEEKMSYWVSECVQHLVAIWKFYKSETKKKAGPFFLIFKNKMFSFNYWMQKNQTCDLTFFPQKEEEKKKPKRKLKNTEATPLKNQKAEIKNHRFEIN